MAKAQDIVEAILGSERFAQARAFDGHLFRDEPILRTGAQAFGRYAARSDDGHGTDMRGGGGRAAGDTRADDTRAASPRAHAARPLYPFEEPVRPVVPHEPLPARYRRMHAMARTYSDHGFSYGAGGSKLFYEQGKFMEDFEDDYEGTCDFQAYYPTYAAMSGHELRCYFSWRTRWRKGIADETPTSFVFVYAYELLCGIGIAPGTRGLAELTRLAKRYGGDAPSLEGHLRRWMHDYVVFYGLDPSLVPRQQSSFSAAAVTVLRQAERAILGSGDMCAWPEVAQEGFPGPAEVFDAMCALSRYRAERSRFFKDHRQACELVACRVFARMVQHCHKRRKTDYVDGLFGEPSRLSYTVFPSAMFWSPQEHEPTTYELAPGETYECSRGFWWRILPCRRAETNRELGTLLHTIDARMRLRTDDAHPLKERKLPKYQAKFVDDEVEEVMGRLEAAEAARVVIDRKALQGIRSASVRTREALLTDEERAADAPVPPSRPIGDVAPAPTAVPQPVVTPAPAMPADPSSDAVHGLTQSQMAILRSLLDGVPVSGEGGGAFLTLEVDAINDAFLDVVGDTVIEYDGETPTLVEDYVQDVREAIA